MNRRLVRTASVLLSFCFSLYAGDNPFTGYWHRRFNAESIDVKEVQGLSQRIENGKLHLHLRDFLELMLKNSPDIQVTRLDVYTAATQIVSARAPFDPSLQVGFLAQRSISPLLFGSGISSGTTTTTGTGSGTNSGSGTGSSVIGGTGAAGSQILPQTINSLSQNSSIAYNQILPTGQTLGTSFNSYRSSGDSYTSPLTYGILNFTFTQPLLQNRTGLQYRGPIRIAETQLLISSEQSEGAIAQAMANAAVLIGRPFRHATTFAFSS